MSVAPFFITQTIDTLSHFDQFYTVAQQPLN
jgi:hypothetical protein